MEFFITQKNKIQKISIFILLYVITFGMVFSALFVLPHPVNTYAPLHVIIIAFASVLLSKYLYYMIASPWHDVWVVSTKKYWKKHNPEYKPLVSVLIPAWNEEVGIIGTIDSLLKSSYDSLEIVIVNDGSKDTSDTLIRERKAAFDALPASEKKIKASYTSIKKILVKEVHLTKQFSYHREIF